MLMHNHAFVTDRQILEPSQTARFQACADEWVESLVGAINVTPLNQVRGGQFADVNLWFANGCEFVFAYDRPSIWQRAKWQAERCAEFVFLHRYLDCTVQAEGGDLNLQFTERRFYLEDQETMLKSVKSGGWTQGILIPKETLGYRSGEHPGFIDLSFDPVLDRALSIEFDHVFGHLDADNSLDLEGFERIVACIKHALGSEFQDADVRRQARDSLSNVIRDQIERTLESPDLNVDSLLKQFGVSRASLYRMFEPYGGVRQYISNRRLFSAVRELSEHRPVRGKINDIAEKWNFSTTSNFHRAVRKVFDMTPGDILNTLYETKSEIPPGVLDSDFIHTPRNAPSLRLVTDR